MPSPVLGTVCVGWKTHCIAVGAEGPLRAQIPRGGGWCVSLTKKKCERAGGLSTHHAPFPKSQLDLRVFVQVCWCVQQQLADPLGMTLPVLQAVSAAHELPFTCLCELTRRDRALVVREREGEWWLWLSLLSWPHRRNQCGIHLQPKSAKSIRNVLPHGMLQETIVLHRCAVLKWGSCAPSCHLQSWERRTVPQPAPGIVLLSRACLAQQVTLFLQEWVKTSWLINQSFL